MSSSSFDICAVLVVVFAAWHAFLVQFLAYVCSFLILIGPSSTLCRGCKTDVLLPSFRIWWSFRLLYVRNSMEFRALIEQSTLYVLSKHDLTCLMRWLAFSTLWFSQTTRWFVYIYFLQCGELKSIATLIGSVFRVSILHAEIKVLHPQGCILIYLVLHPHWFSHWTWECGHEFGYSITLVHLTLIGSE